MSLNIKSGTYAINVSSVTLGVQNAKCAAGVSLQSFTPQQIAQLVHELSALSWMDPKNQPPKEGERVQCLVDYGHEKIPKSVLEFEYENGVFKRGEHNHLTTITYPVIIGWQPLAAAEVSR